MLKELRHHLLPRAPHIHDHRHGTLRPVWRGRLHALAIVAFVPLLAALVLTAPAAMRPAVAVYAVSLLTCLVVSAAYHIAARTPASQTVMQRIDRAAIFLLIAGTYTPVLPLITTPPVTWWLLAVVWGGALTGATLRSLGVLNKTATGLYLAVGWIAVITAPALWHTSPPVFALILTGGLAYTLGAVTYGLKRPTLSVTHFSHHEVFHALTVIGMFTQFAAVWILITTV